jgi:uncharacterized protein with HEPN domain
MKASDLDRLMHIMRYCEEIEATVNRFGNTLEVFLDDDDYRKSIALSLLEIGELSNGLSDDFKKSTREHIQWGFVVGMRNHVAHGYRVLEKSTIFETVQNDIPILKAFCSKEIDRAEQQLGEKSFE